MKKKSGNFVDNVPIQLAKKSFLKDSLDFVIGEEKNSGNSKKMFKTASRTKTVSRKS